MDNQEVIKNGQSIDKRQHWTQDVEQSKQTTNATQETIKMKKHQRKNEDQPGCS
jgi:hypothetical protein